MLRLALSIAYVIGCAQAPAEELTPTEPPVPVKADVLFVVDISGGSLVEQDHLVAAFPRFLGRAGHHDLRIGVISTDITTAGGEQEGRQTVIYSADFPWILTDFNRTDCHTISPPLDHGCARGRVLDTRAMAKEELVDGFGVSAAMGNCGSGTELAFRATLAALDHRNDCNAGLFRDDALLILVFFLDDDLVEREAPAELIADLGQRKPLDQIRMGAVIGVADGEPADCGFDAGADCGSLCDANVPLGSGAPCTMSNQCPAGEYCNPQREQCENEDRRYFSSCHSCSFYAAPDCCSAQAGVRFVELLRELEATTGKGTAIGSICGDVGDALDRIAMLIDT